MFEILWVIACVLLVATWFIDLVINGSRLIHGMRVEDFDMSDIIIHFFAIPLLIILSSIMWPLIATAAVVYFICKRASKKYRK